MAEGTVLSLPKDCVLSLPKDRVLSLSKDRVLSLSKDCVLSLPKEQHAMRESGVIFQQQIQGWIQDTQRAADFRRWAQAAQADGYDSVAFHLSQTAANLELITHAFRRLLDEMDDPLSKHAHRQTRPPGRPSG